MAAEGGSTGSCGEAARAAAAACLRWPLRGRTGRRPPPGSSAATGSETGAQGPRRAAPCRSSPKGLSSRQTLLFRAYDGYKLPDEQRFERRLGTATGSPCPRSIACAVCCSSAAVGSARGRSHVLCRCCGYLLGRLLAIWCGVSARWYSGSAAANRLRWGFMYRLETIPIVNRGCARISASHCTPTAAETHSSGHSN